MSTAIVALAKYLPPDRVDDAAQLLNERDISKLELVAAEVWSITDVALNRPLDNDREEAATAELLSRGVVALKELDAMRRARVDPLNQEVKAVNAICKIISDPAEALVGKGCRLERMLLAYRQVKAARVRREQEEAQRKQREAAEAEEAAMRAAQEATTVEARAKALAEADAASRTQAAAALAEPQAMPRGVRTDTGSVTTRKEWKVEVIDEALVPREYLMVDAAKLRAAVKAGVREIPGCNVFEDEALTRRVG